MTAWIAGTWGGSAGIDDAEPHAHFCARVGLFTKETVMRRWSRRMMVSRWEYPQITLIPVDHADELAWPRMGICNQGEAILPRHFGRRRNTSSDGQRGSLGDEAIA